MSDEYIYIDYRVSYSLHKHVWSRLILRSRLYVRSIVLGLYGVVAGPAAYTRPTNTFVLHADGACLPLPTMYSVLPAHNMYLLNIGSLVSSWCLLSSFWTGYDRPFESFKRTYTAVQRLTVRTVPICGADDETTVGPASCSHFRATSASRRTCVVVETQFTGPQSAERPAILLGRLFHADRIAVHPVTLRRGRKRAPKIEEEKFPARDQNRAPADVHSTSGRRQILQSIPPSPLTGGEQRVVCVPSAPFTWMRCLPSLDELKKPAWCLCRLV